MTPRDTLQKAAQRDVSRETWQLLQAYEAAIIAENQRQNLVSPASIPNLFHRHIVDSAQLVPLSRESDAPWIDVGSGPGLPGIVIAILTKANMTLVEPRGLRVEFLLKMKDELSLGDRVNVVHGKAAAAAGHYANVTARAVAALPKFFGLAAHLANRETCWILPKGKSAKSELEEAKKLWQGEFRLAQSQTDPEAAIVVATGVKRKGKR